jgi:hypothetical protein
MYIIAKYYLLEEINYFKFDINTKTMVKKNIILSCILLSALSIMKAQMVGTNAYIKGTNVEIGFSGAGGFEGADVSVSPPITGMHYRSGTNYFGFVANPQLNGWATFDGDFFTPGSPENGWGFEIPGPGGVIKGNNCNFLNDISGTITSWTHVGTIYTVIWEGDATTGTNLHLKIEYNLNETDLFYTTTVTVYNNTVSAIPDLYYYRNVDPDNNQSLSADYTTLNVIVSQQALCGYCPAHVSAEQTTPWNSYFAFIAVDSNFMAGYGGFSNRGGSDMYNGVGFTQTVGANNFADEAIYIAHRNQNLAAGDSSTFKFCTVFDESSVDCATNSLTVSFPPLAAVAPTAPSFVLTGGTPAGGIYSGTGVTGGNTFDPSVSGSGTFNLVYTVTDTMGCSSSAISTIVVDVAAGISENTANDNLSVHPNPFSDQTVVSLGKNVNFTNSEFHVYDVLGKEVISVTDIKSSEFKIERGGLPAGVYFYRLTKDKEILTEGKILIK